MKNILICFFSLIFCWPISGQFNHKRLHKVAKEMAQRKLLVVLEEPRTDLKSVQKILAKYPQRLEAYQKYVDQYNKELKLMVQKYWKLHAFEDIEFMTWLEMKERQKEGTEEYAVLCGNTMVSNEKHDYYINHIDSFYDYKIKEKKNKIDTIGTTRFAFNLDYLENIKEQSSGNRQYRSSPLYLARLPIELNDYNYKHWLYGMMLLNFYHVRFLNNWKFEDILNEMKPKQKRLKDKILVIHEEQIVEKKLSTAEIKDLYPYALEIVNNVAYNQYIASENSKNYAFLVVGDFPAVSAFYTKTFTLHLVIDGENGDILAISPVSRSKASIGFSQERYTPFPFKSLSLPVTKKRLADYTKFIEK